MLQVYCCLNRFVQRMCAPVRSTDRNRGHQDLRYGTERVVSYVKWLITARDDPDSILQKDCNLLAPYNVVSHPYYLLPQYLFYVMN